MNVAKKLKRLTEFMHKAKVARAAGVTVETLDNALSERRSPSRGTCVRLAAALEIDAGWLMDDTKGWPPVRTEQQAVA